MTKAKTNVLQHTPTHTHMTDGWVYVCVCVCAGSLGSAIAVKWLIDLAYGRPSQVLWPATSGQRHLPSVEPSPQLLSSPLLSSSPACSTPAAASRFWPHRQKVPNCLMECFNAFPLLAAIFRWRHSDCTNICFNLSLACCSCKLQSFCCHCSRCVVVVACLPACLMTAVNYIRQTSCGNN